LSFDDGSISRPLQSGLNNLTLSIAHTPSPGGSQARLIVRAASGAVVTSFAFKLTALDLSTVALQTLTINPSVVSVDDENVVAQVAVTARLADGRTVNVTTGASGTSYAVSNPAVAQVTADGLVVAVAGGSTELVAKNGAATGAALVQVALPAALQQFEVVHSNVTLTNAGAT